MKTRLLWIAIVALGLTALYFRIAPPHISTIPSELRNPLSDIKPPPLPPFVPPPLVIPPTPTITPPVLPPPRARLDLAPQPPEVPIQPNATIDFSTGSPHVKMHGADKEALDAAIKEISEVAAKTGFEAKKEGGQNARP
jgi:hypothetical protein